MLEQMKRVVHFDFHTMPGIDDFGARFDAAAFAEELKRANVAYINMFGRCNLGFSYYPTKVGFPYPSLSSNMLGDVVRECHARDIGVIGYIHVGLHHELLRRCPDYARMEKDGTVYNYQRGANWFRQPCFFGPYVTHVLEEVKEVLAQGVDGLFLDGINPRACACPRCLAAMHEAGMDITSDEDIRLFSEQAARRFAEQIRALVPKDKHLYFKGLPLRVARDLNTHGEIACLASNMGYDFFPAQAALARPLTDSFLYMNGRFGYDWGDFGGYKGKASVENDFYEALMNGAYTTFGDHLHPAEIVEEAIYGDLGEIYGTLASLERWTDGTHYVAEIALLSQSGEVTPSHEGAARMLLELKYTFNILSVEDDFSGYPLVILPDDITVDGALLKKIDAYLSAGGKILSSGASGLTPAGDGFAHRAWDFAYAGKDPLEVSYYRLTSPAKGLADMRYDTYAPAHLLSPSEGDVLYASHITTYFNRVYDGAHWYFYTPPRNETAYAQALLNKEKNLAQIAFPVFDAFRKTQARGHRALVGQLLSALLSERLLRADDLPSSARVSITRSDAHALLHVKVTYPEIRGESGIVEEHTVLPAGKRIAVKGEYRTVTLLPSETPVSFCVKDGYTEITLPEIVGYALFLLQ